MKHILNQKSKKHKLEISETLNMSSSSNVFELGKYVVVVHQVDTTGCFPKKKQADTKGSFSFSTVSPSPSVDPPSKPLLIATPSEEGEYPVLVFLHGYLYLNSFYSQLIQHIASHGFIVVAPQLYWIAGPNVTDDIKSAAAVTDWLSEGLQSELTPLVRPNLSKLALTGHSRGGKAAFALALGLVTQTSLKYSVLLGIDPVDGLSKECQTTPKVLTYVPRSFNLNMPVMVIGSGLGEIKKNIFFPACAPKGVNYKDFYDECRSPACYFVAKDYGHNDVLDDDTGGIRGVGANCLCKNGKTRKPMRTFVGGIMVAFMKAYLEGDHGDLDAIQNGQEPLPVELEAVDFRM